VLDADELGKPCLDHCLPFVSMSIFQQENALPLRFARILIAKPVSTFAEYAPAADRACTLFSRFRQAG
jgi:hypothetical protein